jgi:hypothetical protein
MTRQRLIASVLAQATTATGTLVALALWDTKSAWRPTLIGLVLVVLLSAVALDLWDFRLGRAKGYRTPARINRFMHDWISQGGRVAIFSNDMSWVSDDVYVKLLERAWMHISGKSRPNIKELLTTKAANDELLLCLPRANRLAKELESQGAKLATYEDLGFVPEGRFTIVRHGQQDASVAIGSVDSKGVRRIEKFPKGRHPAFAMAEDLVTFVTRYAERS